MPLTLHRTYLLALAALIAIGCWIAPIDAPAREQVNDGLKRALTTFAAARALGAVVSVAQGTQVAATPGGVGVNFAPGEALKPLNELIEQFAAIMLAASVSFGIQLILLNVGAHALMSWLVCGVTLVWVAWRWRAGSNGNRNSNSANANRNGNNSGGSDGRGVGNGNANTTSPAPRWLQSALIGLLLVRFAVPLSALATEQVYRTFMASEYQTALTGMEKSPAAVLGAAQQPPPSADESWLDRLKNMRPSLDAVKQRYDRILQAASDWAERIVRLIALFVLQTIVLPLGFLYVGWRVARAAVGGGAVRAA